MENFKYYIIFCKCGRIHFIKMDDIDTAISIDHNLIMVCGGCGMTRIIGADKTVYDGEGTEYNIYAYEKEEDFEITQKSFDSFDNKPFTKIIFSQGKKVYMKNGFAANFYSNGIFRDTWFIGFDALRKVDITKAEVHKMVVDWMYEYNTVDMERLINDLSEDELKELSGYSIKSFDWTGTKYCKF